MNFLVIAVTGLLIIAGLCVRWFYWEIIVKQDLKFMTEAQFKKTHPLVYRALNKNKVAMINTKTNKIFLVCPVCKKNPIAIDRDGTCVDCSH